MPTDLGREFEITWRGKPPHMLIWDVPVWHRFLNKLGFSFSRVFYDVSVGGPHFSKKQLEDPLTKMWSRLTSKRIDALVETPKNLWLIEVAKLAGLRAVGQLHVYNHLWTEDPKIDKPVKLVLVCAVIDPDILLATTSLNIHTYVMPHDNSKVYPV